MKIGILTFHSQLNYGGVLQCWALQTALERMGHEVVVIDRWHNPDNSLLECGYNKFGLKQWIKLLIRLLLGLGDFSQWQRVKRTKKFLKAKLNLTPYHFVDWNDAPKNLDLDIIVVGSDQVWHCGDWGNPAAYLLEGGPDIPAVSYAASFGLSELPHEFSELFKRGLSRFKAISCREREGVEICSKLGFCAEHVVDPTLLAWGAAARSVEPQKRELVCYFLSEKLVDHIDELVDFARKNHCKVKVLMNSAWIAAFPSSIRSVKSLVRMWKVRMFSGVEIMDGAGPAEFYQAFKSATWVVSDSFHALMFSIINGCNVRIIRPTSEFRRRMFARIEEFALHTQGPLVVDSVSDALISFARGEKVGFDCGWINHRCHESEKWLRYNIQ